jgi:hypothetical protein
VGYQPDPQAQPGRAPAWPPPRPTGAVADGAGQADRVNQADRVDQANRVDQADQVDQVNQATALIHLTGRSAPKRCRGIVQ